MNSSIKASTKKTLAVAFAALAVCVVALASANPAHAVTAAEKQAEAEAALNELYAMEGTLEEASNTYYAALSEYADAVENRDAAQTRIDEISEEIATIQGRLGDRARGMYRDGSTSFIDLLLGAASFEEFSQNWDLLTRMNENDAELSSKARALREEAKEKHEEYSKQADRAEAKSKEAEESYHQAEDLLAEMQATYDALSAEAQELYAQEMAAQAAAQQAAAEQAAAEQAAYQAAYQAEIEAVSTGDYGDDGDYSTVSTEATEAVASAVEESGGTVNDDGSITDSSGQTYASASEYDAATGNAVVDRALSMVGSGYEWGATGTNGTFDCSGLVGYAITGTTERIGSSSTFMDYEQVSDPQPGDIAVTDGHTGIYIGDGQMVHASDESTGVIVGDVQDGMIFVRYDE